MPKSSDSDNSAKSTADIIGHLSEAISRVDTSRSIAQEENAVRPVRSRALRLLDHRARSEQELRDRLLDAEFPQASVDTVIADLAEGGLIDDRRFAEEWVRQRRTRRGKSRRVLREELRRKGVSDSDCDHALAEVSDDDEQELARRVAEDRARRIRTAPADRKEQYAHLRRIAAALARRGFPAGMSQRIAHDVVEERITELSSDPDGK
ncbi:regulatory protein RecX [Corynebacterium kroppenstedtii]|nr:regulatory protein RecX [Corynebacterium kroppenstedtii]